MKKLKKRLERKLVCEVKVRICLQASLEYPVLIPSAIKLPICQNQFRIQANHHCCDDVDDDDVDDDDDDDDLGEKEHHER